MLNINNLVVENLKTNSGNSAKNQFYIEFKDNSNRRVVGFQSYKTIMSIIVDGKLYINNNKDNYTNTTSKYFKKFLNEQRYYYDRKEFFKTIDNSEKSDIIVSNESFVQVK